MRRVFNKVVQKPIWPVTRDRDYPGLEKTLKFQLTLCISSSQILLALRKSKFTFFFFSWHTICLGENKNWPKNLLSCPAIHLINPNLKQLHGACKVQESMFEQVTIGFACTSYWMVKDVTQLFEARNSTISLWPKT